MEWPRGKLPYQTPFTLGHENAGWVESIGMGAGGLEIGQPVAVYGPWGCGHCRSCLQGMDNCCEERRTTRAGGGGLGLDGGMAEYMLVPQARHLVPLQRIDPVHAAPLTDAALTPYHAIQRSLAILLPGSTAVVIGVGGLGHLAVQLLGVLSTTRVIAVDVSPERLQLAKLAGAIAGVVAGDGAESEIRDLCQGRGAELVLDFVGSNDSLRLASKVSRVLGHVTLVGAGGGTVPFSFFEFPQECSLLTSSWGSLTELMEVIELAESGQIAANVQTFALSQVETAYEALKGGMLNGRAVIIPEVTSPA
jgi:propanol-preferring alcohol dehydrogenase